MAKKGQSTKRQASATRAKNRARKQEPTTARAKVELSPGRLTVIYDDPNQILPTLLEVSSHFASQHIVSFAGMLSNVLGTARAQVIVSGCANSTSWSRTLGDIGVSFDLLRNCIFKHMTAAGFTIELSRIPTQPDTKLADVVAAIEFAPSTLSGEAGIQRDASTRSSGLTGDVGVDNEAHVEESDSLAGDPEVNDP